MVVYMSRTYKQPNSSHCEKTFKNPTSISLDDKERFTEDFVYITFESENGCNVEMKTTFPMEDKRAE